MSDILSVGTEYCEFVYHRAGVPQSCHFSFGDDRYHLYTPRDVSPRLADSCADMLRQLGFTFKDNKRDCDKFTRFAVAWSDFLSSENQQTEYAPMFCEVWSAALAHAFCSAIHRRDGECYVAWYEPQLVDGYSLTPIELTPEQIASIYEIRR